MNNLDISIIEEWPFLKIIVNLPNGRVLQEKAVWHIAATQFMPKVQTAFQEAINAIIEKNKKQRNLQDPSVPKP